MPVIYTNNASTTISAGISSSVTTITIASASGFPSIGASEYFFATLANTDNTKIEIVKVTAGTTSLTVVRGQDGTTAQAFDSGDNFQVRVTSATLESATVSDVNITGGSIATAAIADDAVTEDKLANSINSAIAANTAKTTNATHTGDVTGGTALTIAVDAVDIAMLSATGTASSSTYLRGDNSWVAIDTSTLLPKAGGAMTGAITTNSTFDTRDVANDGTKLDTIETNAKDDQTASEITALGIAATSVTGSQASAITANTAKVTNATHTGDVTGGTALTIAAGAVDLAMLATSLGDLRRGVTYVGRDTNDYIEVGTTVIRFYINGVRVLSVDASGNAIFKGDVTAFGTPV